MKSKDFSEKTEIDEKITETSSSKKPNRVFKFNNLSNRQKSLIQSASSGLAGVSLAALAMTIMGTSPRPSDEDDIVAPPTNTDNRKADGNDIEVPIYCEAPFSDAVNDGMSFNEAFGAARVDIGPGGFFEWHGQTYNTYYKEEWDALSHDEQNEFYASVDDNHTVNDIAAEDEILDILNGEDDIEVIDDLDDYEDIVIEEHDAYDDVDMNDDIVILDDDQNIDDIAGNDNDGINDDVVDMGDDNDIYEDDLDVDDLG